VFGVLAAAARLSARCLTTWKSLCERAPNAVILVCPLNASDRAPIRRALLAAGIRDAQIRALPGGYVRPRDLSLNGVVDIILDTMPGSDYFSTRAAILDAIPIVTTSGRMFEERIAFSMLTQLGDTSTVGESGRDYVDIATRLATDKGARAESASRMRRLLSASALLDATGYVARFEAALFTMTATPRAAQTV
ncbi:MAG: hypothetical protein ABL931_17380, partial [Usitatibacteraceae bacterium]